MKNLKLGGIHSWTEETNKVKILNNIICYNHYGIVCVGADASNFIEGNTIENSKGPGAIFMTLPSCAMLIAS